MLKIDFVFYKKGNLKFISHLDLMRLFVRAMRRAQVPVKITEGFSPHPKFSIKRALKLGLESENEEACIVLKELMDPGKFVEKLNCQLPEGIRVKSANLIQQF
jgi:radical SAM-linked protein